MKNHRVLSSVLSIQSHVVHGHVGNKSATFPLQLLGYEVDPLNTVQFSNHTGYSAWKGLRFDAQHIEDILKGLECNGLLNPTHILVGYVGSVPVLEVLKTHVERIFQQGKKAQILIDPVLGDDGKLYCPKECIPIYREMIRFADCITPNEYEAAWLCGMEEEESTVELMVSMIEKLHESVERVVITSANIDDSMFLFCSERTLNCIHQIKIPKVAGKFTGTGDLFAALLLAHLDSFEIEVACARAISTLNFILETTIKIRGGPGELAIIQCAKEILNPPALALESKRL